jgi:D-sedoheptulose 7-phosphate isomerase
MSDALSLSAEYRRALGRAIERLDDEAIVAAIGIFERAWTEDRLVLLAGNGGSAATAEHMDLDLSKTIARLAGPGRGFRTIALTHGPALSAWANDVGPDAVFAGQVHDLGRPRDVLVLISAKGNSPNIVEATR